MQKSNAFDYCVKLLTKRDYSRFKLKQKLIQRDHSEDEVEEVIERLQKLNYLREENYARMRIKNLLLSGYSNQFIQSKLELEELFVSEQLIDTVRQDNGLVQESALDQLIDKKMRSKQIPDDADAKLKLKNKLLSFLASKGYDFDEIQDRVDSWFNRNE
ncbi:MAG: regulatory protein RecX [Bacteriovoracaceae bacterium]|nr:regulatory protein RecX [Bacteriovoracaceae bacterium]